ncbi:ANTAR domain-containing protein [Rhodococcus sp. X156]|uniref:ANTAR domain-containing protein n=1 Tax=Rhodococcus sp. X156 TaxID=2499145 RepID=UPI000FDADEF3|nr:ANTAR domain-containing protein [Rhodococcus sp. X156]
MSELTEPGAASQLCTLCLRDVPVDGAAVVMLAGQNTRRLLHATDETAYVLDELQFTLGEGPCLTAFTLPKPLFENDMVGAAAMARWPGYAREAAIAGAGAAFAFALRIDGTAFGVLELYRRAPGPLSEESVATAQQHADSLAGPVLDEGLAGLGTVLSPTFPDSNPERMHLAQMTDRNDVHQAAGMLAVRQGLSVPDALAVLRSTAYAENRWVVEVAQEMLRDNGNKIV